VLIDRFLPEYDVSETHSVEIGAGWRATYAAIREADLDDPLIHGLFRLRELPRRITGRWRRPELPADDPPNLDVLIRGGHNFVLLGEVPGIELVVGSIGRFWRKDYGARAVSAAEFARFDEPGYAKLVVSFSVVPQGPGAATLRYEARTATTDEESRKRFRRYWRLIRPGVALIMRRVLLRIKQQAEQPSEVAV
jgi:hypothetical protein